METKAKRYRVTHSTAPSDDEEEGAAMSSYHSSHRGGGGVAGGGPLVVRRNANNNKPPVNITTVKIPKRATLGSLRYLADLRQLGGLLMLLGFASVVAPLPRIVSLIGPNNTTALEGIPLSTLIGSLCLCTIGVLSVAVGYAQTVHDWSHPTLTAFIILFTQTAFIPYITDMTMIGRGAASGANAFGFKAYQNHTSADVKFVGAMGILGVLCYGFAYVGSISFVQFAQYAYISGKPEERSAPYYRGRQYAYCAALAVAGASQLFLGSYLTVHYGPGLLPNGPIAVAVYTVNVPILTMLVGMLQCFAGVWGICRAHAASTAAADAIAIGMTTAGDHDGNGEPEKSHLPSSSLAMINNIGDADDDNSFQLAMLGLWLLQLGIQIVCQIALSGRDQMAAMPAMITSMSLGLNLMPALLDYKSRALPECIAEAELYNNSRHGGGNNSSHHCHNNDSSDHCGMYHDDVSDQATDSIFYQDTDDSSQNMPLQC